MAGATPRTFRLQDLTVDVSLSGVAQGDLFYRGSSKWNNLAAGTAGNLLATGGSGANPSWASRLTYASSGTLLTVTAGATTDVPFAVNGAASQSADLAQFKVNGTTKARFTSGGTLHVPSGSTGGTGAGLNFGSTADQHSVGWDSAWGYVTTRYSSVAQLAVGMNSLFVPSGSALLWSSGTIPTNAADTGVKRSSAGVVTITNGSTGVGSLELGSGGNIILSTTTGTKIGTGTTQLLGFYNATPVDQPATVTDPSGGATVDAEARTAIIAVIDRLQELGLIA